MCQLVCMMTVVTHEGTYLLVALDLPEEPDAEDSKISGRVGIRGRDSRDGRSTRVRLAWFPRRPIGIMTYLLLHSEQLCTALFLLLLTG